MPVGLPADAQTIRKHSTWFLVYGIVVAALGSFAIAAPMVATLAIELTVAWLLVFGGVMGLIAVFSGGRETPGFAWNLLISIVYLLAGLSLLMRPATGAVTLTIVLVAYLLAGGIARTVLAFAYRHAIPGAWVWVLFSGIVDIALSIIIMSGLPGTATWVLGLLVGINLLMMGFSIVMVAIAVRGAVDGSARPA